MTFEEFAANFRVSRETFERLVTLGNLVRKWNRAINLVATSSLDDFWSRHIADSAQLVDLAPKGVGSWVDLGSGAGFPGLVAAAMLADHGTSVILIESDQRKSAFLRSAAANLGLDVEIRNERIERSQPVPADVVSARALAPLSHLLGYALPFCHGGTVLLFPKGRSAQSELTVAEQTWHIHSRLHQSRTDPEAHIVEARNCRPRS